MHLWTGETLNVPLCSAGFHLATCKMGAVSHASWLPFGEYCDAFWRSWPFLLAVWLSNPVSVPAYLGRESVGKYPYSGPGNLLSVANTSHTRHACVCSSLYLNVGRNLDLRYGGARANAVTCLLVSWGPITNLVPGALWRKCPVLPSLRWFLASCLVLWEARQAFTHKERPDLLQVRGC